MIDVKDEKRDIYDYFDLIDQAKTKKEREGYIDEALLSGPDNLRLLLIKNEKNRKKQAECLVGLANIVSIGDKQMQEGGYFQNDKGDFWLVYETRPYKGVSVRDYKKTKNILMGTPARKSVKRVQKNLSSFYYFLI